MLVLAGAHLTVDFIFNLLLNALKIQINWINTCDFIPQIPSNQSNKVPLDPIFYLTISWSISQEKAAAQVWSLCENVRCGRLEQWLMDGALVALDLSSYKCWTISGWWFGTCFVFPYGNNHPNWLIFFRGIETTNQIYTALYIPFFKIYCIVQ